MSCYVVSGHARDGNGSVGQMGHHFWMGHTGHGLRTVSDAFPARGQARVFIQLCAVVVPHLFLNSKT